MGQTFLCKVNANVIMVLFLFTLLTPFMFHDYSTNHFNQIQTNDSRYNDIWDDSFYNKLKLDYTPINSLERTGSIFSIEDDISVHQVDSLSLGNGRTDQFTISGLTGYYVDSLSYDMTITGKKDIYEQRDVSNKDEVLTSSNIRVAQAFDVPWDNAVFYGAEVNLIIDTPIGGDELELFIVKARASDEKPNMDDIRTNATNDPYTFLNPINVSVDNNLVYYDFHDVVLEQGKYFVVANLSKIDGNDGTGFNWRGQQMSLFGDSYNHDGTDWGDTLYKDLCLNIQLMPSFANGTAFVFSDPTTISLEDGGQPITSLTQTISSTGTHTLSADTYVDVDLNNSYIFTRTYSGSSSFQVTNSTFNEESVDWYISWSIDAVDFSSYSNPTRSHTLLTPNDWNETALSFLLDTITPLPGQKLTNGFTVDLVSLLSGNTYTSGDISFSTTSTNYLYDYTLTDGFFETTIFNLGYWTYNTTHAIGYEGSTVSVDILIKDCTLADITTGELNFTIYNSTGEVIPFKTSIYANLSYTDTSNYTILSTTQTSAGLYEVNTTFDPSVYGTDVEGYWTAVYYWNNGTEVGFFSKRITVIKDTEAIFEWEELPANGEWFNNSLQDIRRINGHDISIRVVYYHLSDPFFTGYGTLISGGEVFFSTSWGDSGNLVFDSPYYEYSIPTDFPPSDHFIYIEAMGQFLENHTINFVVKILHQFTIENLQTVYYTNYTNEAIIEFRVLDVSNSSVPVLPDSMIFSHNGTSIDSADYSTRILGDDTIEITFETVSILSSIDSHDIGITISKAGFIASYTENDAESSVSLSVLPIVTEIEIVNSVSSINYNNQTTVSFRLIDTNHSTHLTGANFEIHADIEGVEITSHSEDEGLYFFVVTVHEPSLSSVNIFLNITKEGYVAKQNYLLTSIGITPGSTQTSTLPPDEGAPLYMYLLIAFFAAIIIGGSAFYIFQRRRSTAIREKKEIYKHISSIYQSVLSLKKLIVVHTETSLPIFEMDFSSEIEVDPSLISGFLQAVSTIGGEMVGKESGGVKRIDYQDLTVTSTLGGRFVIHTFSDGELYEHIENRLSKIVQWFSLMFGSSVEDWDGSTEIFRLNKEGIAEKIMGEIFLWLFYPLDITTKGVENLENMKDLEKRIFTFMQENGSSTMSRIIDILDDLELEETLIVLFDLVDKGYIKPNYSAYDIVTIRL